MNGKKTVLLMGNANVGKSTVFNELTGAHQHTGNWTGKTVDSATGHYYYKFNDYTLIDLPGTYSLDAVSEEEKIARDYLREQTYDCVVCVLDATALQRNLHLLLQVLSLTDRAVVLLNLCDEARKKNIAIDTEMLSQCLGVPVVRATARSGKGINALLEQVHDICLGNLTPAGLPAPIENDDALRQMAQELAAACVTKLPSRREEREAKLDRLLLGKYTSIPLMLAMVGIVLWITIVGSNVPSEWLRSFFDSVEESLAASLLSWGMSERLISLLVYGVLGVLFWVVSVMLPPMAIFFPLFALLEAYGLLPRLAFNLDGAFCRCGGCGKQALTCCMGFGCNAVGVTGCRIIDSPKERLIAILTNSLIPCNGRFPLLIAMIAMFFSQNSLISALILLALICVSMVMTLLGSLALNKTVLKGQPSTFLLELPPFRKPRILRVLREALGEKVLRVLLRAVVVALPAGFVIWVLANTEVGDSTLLVRTAQALDPVGRFLGLDGVMLLAFLLGFPANEIVIPIALMTYLAKGEMSDYSSLESLRDILISNGWTAKTALCTCLFTMFHFPCSTTLLTIWKETKSVKWTAVSVLLPLSIGVLLCAAVNVIL